MSILFRALLVLVWASLPPLLPAQNALHFDGEGDWVELSLAGTNLPNGNSDFTIDMWFQSQTTTPSTACGGNFRRMFSLNSATSRFEVGVCGPNLNIFHALPGNTQLNTTSIATVIPLGWHHIIAVKSGNDLSIWLDCVQVFNQSITANVNLLFTDFLVGHWKPGNNTPGQDWLGLIDEVHLYDVAVPVSSICSANHCPLSGNESGLVANWTFNEGNAGGNNTSFTQVSDFSVSGAYPGQLSSFTPSGTYTPFTSGLTGNSSNFITSTAPITYPALHNIGFEIRNYPYATTSITSICSGDPAHFCLSENGLTPGPFNNVTVQWEYLDSGGSSWLPLASPPFTDFCFPILPGVLTLPCSSSPDGFVDRKFRAIMTVTNTLTGDQCEYISPEQDLQICCPISPATVTLSPSGPYCEGSTETFTATLNSPDPFVQTPGPHVTLNWYYVDPIAATRTFIGSGSGSVSHTVTFPQVPAVTNFCFEVDVTNCNGKMATFSACIPVDPEPVCGDIDACPLGSPQNLLPLDLSDPSHLIYAICPGNDAIVCQNTPFLDCIPQWQYTFTDPAVATPADWVDMGLSNTTQNTNILPSHLWPAGQTSIYYRIQCNPLSNPSGCEPCFSNIVEIQLIQAPSPASITGPAQVCVEDLPAALSVSNPMGGLSYTWLHEGLVIGSGTSLIVSQGGCYWLEVSNGCQTVEGPSFCLDVCETIATISCPLPPNECADPDFPVSLSACGSINTCSGNTGNALQYLWSTGDTNCSITVSPAAGGSTYSVTVTDPSTGCVGVAQQTVVPCDAD